ncbi:hypothetical protein BN946_scf185027.g16 [Trametes cinnabarina]|uniref:Uncharacterized protein n=1 Tax=Pycnoporus cinnabarinus TaxID=5643 RepID=A0A060SUK4_PYCCI|nr:hypothetical protein BN946_scf185027.g16 [Trametes cinnabarina]
MSGILAARGGPLGVNRVYNENVNMYHIWLNGILTEIKIGDIVRVSSYEEEGADCIGVCKTRAILIKRMKVHRSTASTEDARDPNIVMSWSLMFGNGCFEREQLDDITDCQILEHIGSLELVQTSHEMSVQGRAIISKIDAVGFDDTLPSLKVLALDQVFWRSNIFAQWNDEIGKYQFREGRPISGLQVTALAHMLCGQYPLMCSERHCRVGHPRIYAPSSDTVRYCERCCRWYHEVCLTRVHNDDVRRGPPSVEQQKWYHWPRVPGTLTYEPLTGDDLQWKTILRMPIAHVPCRAGLGLDGPTNVRSYEKMLFAVREYHREYNSSPLFLSDWLREHLGGEVPASMFSYAVSRASDKYFVCVECGDWI